MSVSFSEEREQLRAVVREFLADVSGEDAVRASMTTATGWDPAVWRALADDLGILGLGIPEELGGVGYGFAEIGVVAEETGAALLCAPYLATVTAAQALLAAGDDAAASDLLPGLAAGTVATLAVAEADGRWEAGSIQATAEHAAGGWRVSGTKTFVLDGATAELVLVAARTGAGIGLFAVDGEADGLTRTRLATLDQTRRQARLDLAGVPARLIGAEGEAWPAIERAIRLAIVALAAEQVGGAARVLDMAVDYAKTRVQFGRPIGSFQAVKHKLADVLVEVESARSASYAATAAAQRPDDPEFALVTSLAKAFCSDAYVHAAAENIQVHGGIGFTWEHPAHLYLKRAKSSRVLFGDPVHHRELLASQL
ncbi:acyl-CoA/acyl-ACP dehydrogenase [Frankia sp. AgB1.9]|uniref:acyl-CoA dehydrogenase family protein n=1 Tax=Frankia sp. AgB1.9 TaxID=1836968 RepID=UPI001934A8E9|nr:acyl-CoA dehydrogenase family protein [Frankia sp. AgB1.9]MBL7548063.1 acyl-CoA/acyl-ACP dehydrogenase [Frankia sp. AgB1.9]